jgi:hypothetical protein
MHLC